MYKVFFKGIDFVEVTFEGFDKEEAYEAYYETLSDANPEDEVLLTLDGKIIEHDDCEDDQFEIMDFDEFDDEPDFDEAGML